MSRNAWLTLALTYGKPTHDQITQLKTQLSHRSKALKQSQSLYKISRQGHELALMNVPVDIEDLTIKILNGLYEDYKELANTVLAWEMVITFEELHEKLLYHEAQLIQNNLGHISPQANIAASSLAPSSYERFLDSAALDYMTTDLANLSLHSPYDGFEDVVVSNGAGLNCSLELNQCLYLNGYKVLRMGD
ncbi:hypothetical protein RJ641_018172 [Dillenia turbinata]|uniref:Uncharacterized protein n=1 Tax=Dillenia turbinata TaxID=194707 RepID=A0AAN8USX0_9MAGN